MDIAAIQSRIRELLEKFSTRVKQENVSDRYDINRISESIMVPILRLLFDYKKLRNLNYSNEINYPGIDLADDGAKIAFQITSTSDNQKVKHTLTKIKEHYLDKKYNRFVIYILTTKKGKYSDKDYALITENRFSFDKDNDIWDYLDLSKRVSQIDDVATLRKVLDYLEDTVGKGKPFRHNPGDNSKEILELNFLKIVVPEDIYTADIKLDRDQLIESIQERKYVPSHKIYDRDLITESLNINLYRYPKDFVCYESKIVTFHDLNNDEHPFYSVINPKSIQKFNTKSYFKSLEGGDRERYAKDLLRRALARIIYPFGINWHHEEKLFFFTLDEESENYSLVHNADYSRYERIEHWKEKRSDDRYVSFRRYFMDRPEETYYYFHLAFKVKFHLLDDQWYIEITPDWHATRDGYTNSKSVYDPIKKEYRRKRYEYLSEQIKDKKEEEANQAVFNNFRFIRSYLRKKTTNFFVQSFIEFSENVQVVSSPKLEDKIWSPETIKEISEETVDASTKDQTLNDPPAKKRKGRRSSSKKPVNKKNQPNPSQNSLFD